jgi:hypothetical protein
MEQVANFIMAGVFLQPKQMEIAAKCRECDKPDGPKSILAGGGRGPLALDTPILTLSGWKTMGTIEIGDIVFDEKGKQCNVIGKSDLFNDDCYEFEFDCGEKIISNHSHEWLTTSKNEKSKITRRSEEYRAKRRVQRGGESKPCLVGKNVLPLPPDSSLKTTKEIFETVKIRSGREVNHRIKCCDKLDMPESNLPIPPYLLGIWLGDGHTACGRITSADRQIIDKIASLGYQVYKSKQKYAWNVSELHRQLRLAGILNNKHIPEAYLMASSEQRLELVKGLMDSDGTCGRDGNSCFDNKNKKIIDGLCFLLSSLGVKPFVRSKMSKLYGKECGISYTVSFTSKFGAFSLDRKLCRQNFDVRVNLTNHYIVSAKKIDAVPTACITVDSESNLFLCGKNLIPTHNSGKSNTILAQIFCDDCQRIKGLKVLCLRKVGRANKEQIADFRKKLLGNLPHNYREQAQSIEFENGSMVILGNFKDEKDIDKYLGLEYDLIYIMECNQLTRSKIMNILSCLRTNKTNWRPRCYMDTNPGGVSHADHKMLFVDPWKAKKETETRYIHSTVDDNKFVDEGYKAFLEKLVGWQREAWLHGSWEFMAGAFFSNFHADIHVYPNEVTKLNPRAITRWFAGLDYGYSHPNAFTLGCETEDGEIFIVATYMASNTLIEEHAANIRDIISLHGLNIEDLEFIAAGRDCFRVDKDGSTVATEYQERGIMLTPVHIDRVNAWSQFAELLGSPQNHIKPRLFIHKNCTELVTQIQSAQCDPKKPNDILKMNADENGDGGDDILEATRNLLVMAYSSLLSSATPMKMGNYKSLSELSRENPEMIDIEAEIKEFDESLADN